MSDFLLVIIVIFLVFGVFRRYFAFLIINAVSKKLNNKFEKMHRQQQQQQNYSQPQGKVTVEDNCKGGKGKIADEGEYVDFEEVKD